MRVTGGESGSSAANSVAAPHPRQDCAPSHSLSPRCTARIPTSPRTTDWVTDPNGESLGEADPVGFLKGLVADGASGRSKADQDSGSPQFSPHASKQ